MEDVYDDGMVIHERNGGTISESYRGTIQRLQAELERGAIALENARLRNVELEESCARLRAVESVGRRTVSGEAELEFAARIAAQEALEGLTEELGKNAFTDEDIRLIREHVRHPGALEAAKMKERIACALVALSHVDGRHGDVAIAILSAP